MGGKSPCLGGPASLCPPYPFPIPRPFRGALLEFGAKFFKISAQRLPLAPSPDHELNSGAWTCRTAESGIWRGGAGSRQNLELEGGGGGQGFRMGGEGTTRIEGPEFGGP